MIMSQNAIESGDDNGQTNTHKLNPNWIVIGWSRIGKEELFTLLKDMSFAFNVAENICMEELRTYTEDMAGKEANKWLDVMNE